MVSSCCDETGDLKPWPFSSKDFAHNLVHYRKDYNQVRPHNSLGGKTPEEFLASLKEVQVG